MVCRRNRGDPSSL